MKWVVSVELPELWINTEVCEKVYSFSCNISCGDCLITHLKNADLVIKPSDNLHKYLVHSLQPQTMDNTILTGPGSAWCIHALHILDLVVFKQYSLIHRYHCVCDF